MADIWFSNQSRTRVYRLPFLPEEMPELSAASKNEEFETFDNGTYNLIGSKGLISFSLQGILPAYANKYSWAKSQLNPYLIIKLWDDAMYFKTPIRCVMERGESDEIKNLLVTVESMSNNEDKVGDVKYNVSFKEYRQVS